MEEDTGIHRLFRRKDQGMPRFRSVLEIWHFGMHHRSVPEPQSDHRHIETEARGEIAADPDDTNKLLSSDAFAVQPWPKSKSEEQNVTSRGDDSLYDDNRENTLCSSVKGLLPFTDRVMEGSVNNSDSHDFIWNSGAPQIDGKGDVAHSLPGFSPPVLGALNSTCTGTQAVSVIQTNTETPCYASNELWLDESQVPAGEEEESTILDKQNKWSDVTSFAASRKAVRKESGYPWGLEAAIGLPTESTTIETQTLEVMAIKDGEQDPDQSQENTDTAVQMCLSTGAKGNGDLTANRGVEKVQTQLKSQAGDSGVHLPDHGDKGNSEMPLTEEHNSPVTSDEERCSSLLCFVASQNIHETDMTDILPSSEYVAATAVCDVVSDCVCRRERKSAEEEEVDIYHGKKVVARASGEEKFRSEFQSTSETPPMFEPEPDALWEVTEDNVSSLDWDVKEGVESSNGSVTFSDFSDTLSAVDPVIREELTSSTVPRRAEDTVLGDTCTSAHNTLQTPSQTKAEETGLGLSQDFEHLHVNQQDKRNEKPDFIMPLAPLCQRSTPLYNNTTLEGQRWTSFGTGRNWGFDNVRAFSEDEKSAHCNYLSGNINEKLTFCSGQSFDRYQPSLPGYSPQPLAQDNNSSKDVHTVSNLSKELSKLCILTGEHFGFYGEDKKAYITLDLDDTAICLTSFGVGNETWFDHTTSLDNIKTDEIPSVCESKQIESPKMPHKTSKTPSGCKASAGHKSKEKSASRQEKSKQQVAQTFNKQEIPPLESLVTCESSTAGGDVSLTVVETIVITEKCTKSRGKKKKKHASGKVEAETSKLIDANALHETSNQKADAGSGLSVQDDNHDKPSAFTSETNCLQIDNLQKQSTVKNVAATVKRKDNAVTNSVKAKDTDESQSTGLVNKLGKEFLRRKHLFEDNSGKKPVELKPQKPSTFPKKDEQPVKTETGQRRAYSEVVKQKPLIQVEVEVVEGVSEDVKCAPLLFKDDFLSEQYFGENQPASIMTEQIHFGEGMHRRAFRTKLVGGMQPTFTAGHPCVLKVHNVVSQGTKKNEDLIHKNYSLAAEECYVQNTAREYIKAYTSVAKTTEEFGEVPEIIPIFLVHRPSNDIPYATLEEELMGDFVKYSVKDGKEINLTRRDSEAGQKCCAFQHWVYHNTEGNLLVTDMQVWPVCPHSSVWRGYLPRNLVNALKTLGVFHGHEQLLAEIVKGL
ncbi:hypothetical protein JZ751_012253, partial [Albula glossodonta]